MQQIDRSRAATPVIGTCLKPQNKEHCPKE